MSYFLALEGDKEQNISFECVSFAMSVASHIMATGGCDGLITFAVVLVKRFLMVVFIYFILLESSLKSYFQ